MDDKELKPCMCGGKARMKDDSIWDEVFDPVTLASVDCDIRDASMFWVECDDCGASSGGDVSEQEAITAWNTRTIEDALQKENAELKAQLEAAKTEVEKYKPHSKYISGLPDCNTCGIQTECVVRPKLGKVVRINCHLWRGTEEVEDGN